METIGKMGNIKAFRWILRGNRGKASNNNNQI
jgi:hypothetical protein